MSAYVSHSLYTDFDGTSLLSCYALSGNSSKKSKSLMKSAIETFSRRISRKQKRRKKVSSSRYCFLAHLSILYDLAVSLILCVFFPLLEETTGSGTTIGFVYESEQPVVKDEEMPEEVSSKESESVVLEIKATAEEKREEQPVEVPPSLVDRLPETRLSTFIKEVEKEIDRETGSVSE